MTGALHVYIVTFTFTPAREGQQPRIGWKNDREWVAHVHAFTAADAVTQVEVQTAELQDRVVATVNPRHAP